MGTTDCQRCGAPCRTAATRNPDARVLRHSTDVGVCAGCAITEFIHSVPTLKMVVDRMGTSSLLNAVVQEQVGRVLAAGNSDADLSEIDWPTVVANWDLPMNRRRKR